ncbi:MAG: hypothetical protein AAF693_20265 [Bacteroidota bacterium]
MMKITKELLKRHGMGLCTTEEKKAVEEWFDRLEGPMMSTRSFQEIEENKKETWNKLSKMVPELDGHVATDRLKSIPLYYKVTRYVAAACIIFIAFFGGRYSTGTVNANPAPKDPTADHIYIFGAKGAVGNLPGNQFMIEFDGAIKLYNNSISPKNIIVGDTSFMITSRKDFYLVGSTENPELIIQDRNVTSFEELRSIEMEGYFSIHRQD